MATGRFGVRSLVSISLVICMLVWSVPALGAVPPVSNVSSTSHPSESTWYADDSPDFSWDAAGDLPTLLGAYDTPGNARGVAVAGDVAYVADGNSGLHMIDISDPGDPALLGTYDTPGSATSVEVAGDVAYVADYESGLQIIDISNPSTPMLLGTYDTPGAARGLAVAGDVAYVADHESGLLLIDISDPSTPKPLGTYDTPGAALGVAVAGDVAYVADFTGGLQMIDISDPSTPTLLDTYDTPGDAWGVAVAGDVAYVADYGSGLQMIDISDPSAPTLLGSYDTPGNAYGVEVAGDVAYVADFASGLQMVDISDPSAPTLLGTYNTPGAALGVAVAGDVAYVADFASGLQMIDISDVDPPSLLGAYDTPGYAWGIAVAGDVAYVADDYFGLQLIDISDQSAPALLGTYNTPGYAYGVAVAGDVAYVADHTFGLQMIDISDPSTPTLLDTYDTPGEAFGVAVAGDAAYVADYESGLLLIDISDPSATTLLGTYDTPGAALDVAVVGDVAYVADFTGGLQMIDISDPSAPTLLDTYDTPSYAWSVDVVGDVAYVADNESGLQMIDISNPSAPTLLGSYDTPNAALGVEVAGDVAYVADNDSGFHMVDISNPSAPTLLGACDTPGYARGIAVVGDVAYVADWGGFQMIDVGHGPVGYSYALDQDASTVPSSAVDGLATSKSYASVADGEWYFHVRAVGEGHRGGATSHRRIRIDTAAPITTSDAVATYTVDATIELTPDDGTGTSGVASTHYKLDDAASWSSGTSVEVDSLGEHTLEFYSVDNAGNEEVFTAVDFDVVAGTVTYTPLSGANRYDTAIKTSEAAFADDTADCVVIATGTNWPDALGGAALAAAKNGPILLTAPAALTSGVITEIRRLGATEAVILGSTAAVSQAVEDTLEAELGDANVERLGGANRYATANLVAEAAIAELDAGAGYDGTAFVTTGGNFPDALAASPLSAAKGWPIFLSNPAGSPPVSVMDDLGVTDVLILGSTKVVSAGQQATLEATFPGHVDRLWGSDRYATGVAVATYGVDNAGLAWDGLAMSTGANFPDALAGGVLAGRNGSVMLLTASTSLPTSVRGVLTAQRDNIAHVYYLGSTSAISQSVRDAVEAILH